MYRYLSFVILVILMAGMITQIPLMDSSVHALLNTPSPLGERSSTRRVTELVREYDSSSSIGGWDERIENPLPSTIEGGDVLTKELQGVVDRGTCFNNIREFLLAPQMKGITGLTIANVKNPSTNRSVLWKTNDPERREVDSPNNEVDMISPSTGNYSISGKILDGVGEGIEGVLLLFDKGYEAVTTGEDGHWSKDALIGPVVVTPKKDGYVFLPESQVILGPTSSVDFKGGYGISGEVLYGAGFGVAGVEMHLSGDYPSVYTSPDGTWSAGPLTATVTITPMKKGYRFDPPSFQVSEPSFQVDFKGGYVINFSEGLSPYWKFTGEAPWVLDSSTSISDDQSIRSGTITHNETTGIQLAIHMRGSPGILTFQRKVSSEDGFDFLHFLVDGEELDKWSGELDWEEISYQLEKGLYEVEWRYSKDPSTSEGSDSAWIDNISFSGTLMTRTLSGHVKDETGIGVGGVTLDLSDGYGTAITQIDGHWSTKVLSDRITITPLKDGYTFTPTYKEASYPYPQLDFTGTYGISGSVEDGRGNSLEGIILSFLGDLEYGEVITQKDSYWSKDGLSGEVTIVPEKEGYTFDPPTYEVTGPTMDVAFTGTYKVSGSIRDGGGRGLAGVEVLFSGDHSSVTTREDGSWSKDALAGTVTITPKKEGLHLYPLIYEVEAPRNDLDFLEIYELSGLIVDYANDGIGEVKVSFHDGFEPVMTQGDGTFRKGELRGEVTITPYREGYTFTPESRIVDGPMAVNFKGTYGVSGRIEDGNGMGIGGVKITFSGDYGPVKTKEDGTWSKSGLSGTVIVSPITDIEEFGFVPESYELMAPTADLPFIMGYRASGLIKDEVGNPLEGVMVYFSFRNSTSSIVTDGDGFWINKGLQDNVRIYPVKEGYDFEPLTQRIIGPTDDVVFVGGYRVSGVVEDGAGNGIEGVEISFDGGYEKVMTDRDGIWQKGGLSGTVKMFLEKDGYVFVPDHLQLAGPIEEVHSIGGYEVSGIIKDGEGRGIGEVEVRFSGGFAPVLTQDDGGWSKGGLQGTVTFTPVKEGFSFVPTETIVTEGRDDLASLGFMVFEESFSEGLSSPWELFGDAHWVMDETTSTIYERSARSGSISHREISCLKIQMYVNKPSYISFDRKVSSERDYDWLYFFVDGEELDRWSGELDWEQMTYGLEPGLREFKWCYKKDVSRSHGEDCGWIDNIYITGDLPHFYKVSGTVLDGANRGIGGVEITFSDGFTPVETNEDGTWSKDALIGTVKVIPTYREYTFVPSILEVEAPTEGIDFFGGYQGAGVVEDEAGYPIEGVTITSSHGYPSTKTDQDGTWSIEGLVGVVTIAPTHEEYSFIPEDREVASKALDILFTGAFSGTYRVAGKIVDESGIGIGDVEILFSDGSSVITSSDGEWSKDGLEERVIVTPTKEGSTFFPESRVVKGPTTQVHFMGGYTVSGEITDDKGDPLSSIQVYFGEGYTPIITQEDGSWLKSDLSGTITVEPIKEGYVFVPTLYEVAGLESDISFRGTYRISGLVLDNEGLPIEDVVIAFGEEHDPVKIDEGGLWSKGGLRGRIIVEPIKEGYVFVPTLYEVAGPESDISFRGCYVISGLVLDSEGFPLEDVIIAFGEEEDPLKTQGDGTWTKTCLVGRVIITPSKENYEFTPTSLEVHGPGREVDFMGTYSGDYSVSGQIEDGAGKGIGGVEVSFRDGHSSVVTDEDGRWSKDGLSKSITVTPKKEGYVFSPPRRRVGGPTKAVHFTGGYGVSGLVEFGAGKGIGDVELTFSGGHPSVFTSPDGAWSTEALTGTVTITPVKKGFVFNPTSIEVTEADLEVNFRGGSTITFADGFLSYWQFTGEALWVMDSSTFTIHGQSARSGTIDHHGTTGIRLIIDIIESGIISFDRKVRSESNQGTLQFLVDGEEVASFSGELDWDSFSYELKEGQYEVEWRYMKASSGTKGEESGWIDNIFFSGTIKTHALSGQVKDEDGKGIGGVNIEFSDGYKGVTTDGDGHFSTKVTLPKMTITPYKGGYVFEPESRAITPPDTTIDFTGTYGISGFIHDGTERGLGGVTVSFIGDLGYGEVTTDEDGHWSRDGLSGEVVVVPEKDGYTFEPISCDVIAPTNDVSFTSTYEVFGLIEDHTGRGQKGVAITFSNGYSPVTTGEDGVWSKEGLVGTVTVTPIQEDNEYYPLQREVAGPTDEVNFIETYEISGLISDDAGYGILEVLVSFSTDYDSVMTNEDGNWSKGGLIGVVTITPTRDGYVFAPLNQIVDGPMTADFKGSYEISGKVVDGAGVGIGGVELTFSGGYESVITNQDGTWSRDGLSGTVTVTPITDEEDSVFEPESLEVIGPEPDLLFIMGYELFGWVKDEVGNGIEGVEIIFSDGYSSVITHKDGYFSKSGFQDLVTVTPIKDGHIFEPTSIEVSGPMGLDFRGGYRVSGIVKDEVGHAITGVEITFSGGYGSVMTDDEGRWSKFGLSGTVTVTPSKDGNAFDPLSQIVKAPTEDLSIMGGYTLSGVVEDREEKGTEGVEITFSGGYGSVMTDDEGRWSKFGLSGTVTVIPSKEGHHFTPHSRQVRGAASSVDFSLILPGDPGYRTSYTVEGIDFHMRLAPASTFPTGVDDSGTSTVDHCFFIGETQVTYGLWYGLRMWALNNGYTFVNAGTEGSEGEAGEAPSSLKDEPVTTVNWYDCIVWCNALSEYLGYDPVYVKNGVVIKDATGLTNANVLLEDRDGFRLPTSMEWELAARYRGSDPSYGAIEYPAGSGNYWTPGNYASGATADYMNAEATKEVAWYRENSDLHGGRKTQAVGQRPANGNALGLFDMSGNVWEWSFTQSGSPRVYRGGSFDRNALFLQIGYLDRFPPFGAINHGGLRIVRTDR